MTTKTKTHSTMKKIIASAMALAFTLPAYSIEAPERKASGGFENINDRKEYRYDIRPGMVFWREGGRPYWKSTNSSTEMNPSMGSEAKATWNTEEKIRFQMEQAKLDPTDKETLKDLADRLSRDESGVEEVWIMGFASKPGTKEYNQELSEKRAENVKDFLVSQGIDSAMIKATAYGESRALDSIDASRRVEIKILDI